MGAVGHDRWFAAYGAPQPGDRLVAQAGWQQPWQGHRRAREGRALPDRLPLHLAELDELYQAAGIAPEKRLSVFEEHQEMVSQRAEALSREIGLLVLAGRYDERFA